MIIPRDIRDWGVYVGSEPQDTVVRDIGVRVMNELVTPFKAIQMDDTEFACLKVLECTNIQGVPRHWTPRDLAKSQALYEIRHFENIQVSSSCL